MKPTKNQIEAIRLLGTYTRGRYDFWALAGGQNAKRRAEVMTVFYGVRTPQSRAGVTMMREAFYEAFEILGDCQADREERFLEFVTLHTQEN